MQPEPAEKRDPTSEPEVQEPGSGVRVELDSDAPPAPSPRPASAPRVPTVATEGAKRPVPTVDLLGVGGLVVGLGWAAAGFILILVGLALGLDRWYPDWGTGLPVIAIGVVLGVLPGLLGGWLGARRVGHHAQLRRLVAAVRGNDSVDVATAARLLEVDERRARRLIVDALARGLLDARLDVNADRLVLRPKASPFR